MPEKIVWSEAERAALTGRAADLITEEPKLTGLPLLRAALEVLPVERRRRLIALSQAPWFLPALRDEIVRRGCPDETTNLIREQLEIQVRWRDQHLADLDSMQEVLHELVDVVVKQHGKLDVLLSENHVASRAMVERLAVTQGEMVKLLTHIVAEVKQVKEAVHNKPTSAGGAS